MENIGNFKSVKKFFPIVLFVGKGMCGTLQSEKIKNEKVNMRTNVLKFYQNLFIDIFSFLHIFIDLMYIVRLYYFLIKN